MANGEWRSHSLFAIRHSLQTISGEMVGDTGIEPVTPPMSRECSTAELIARTHCLRLRPGRSASGGGIDNRLGLRNGEFVFPVSLSGGRFGQQSQPSSGRTRRLANHHVARARRGFRGLCRPFEFPRASGDAGVLAICLFSGRRRRRNDGRLRNLRDLDEPNGNLYLKRIAVDEPGRGEGTRFLASLIDWAFAHTAAHRIYLDCFVENLRAQRAYAKLGFTRDGVLRQAYLGPDGRRRDLTLMALTRPEWTAGQRKA